MSATKLTEAQATALRRIGSDCGPGESWAEYSDRTGCSTHLAWANHERMMDSLTRRGLLGPDGVTDAGRSALAAHDARRKEPPSCEHEERARAWILAQYEADEQVDAYAIDAGAASLAAQFAAIAESARAAGREEGAAECDRVAEELDHNGDVRKSGTASVLRIVARRIRSRGLPAQPATTGRGADLVCDRCGRAPGVASDGHTAYCHHCKHECTFTRAECAAGK